MASAPPPSAAPATAYRHGRAPLLDCIRAIAILAVFFYHVTTRYPIDSLDPLARLASKYGFLGVDIFFPLSGFLITRFLLQSTSPHLVQVFFLRRAFRILPLYMLAVVFYVLAALVTHRDPEILGRIWINILFLTGWFIYADGVPSVPFTITWSLSVEEFGYILLGLMAWISRARLGAFVIFLCIAPLALRFALVTQGAENLYYFPLTRLDSIGIGGVTALLVLRGQRYLVPGLAAALIVVLGLMQLDRMLFKTLLFTAIALGTATTIALAETRLKALSGRLLRFVADIGFFSYFNYLFQFFVIEAVLRISTRVFGDLPWFWPTALVALVVTQGLALLSYRIFEAPLMRLGRRLEPKSAGPA